MEQKEDRMIPKFSYPPNFDHDDEIACWQNPFEFYETVRFLKAMEAHTLLEIGTGWGEFARFLRTELDILVWSIDSNPMKKEPIPNLFVADSQSDIGYQWAQNKGPFDVVFIDGDHRYDFASNDYIFYSKLARQAVIIHDIDGNQAGKYPVHIGTKWVWDKLKDIQNTIEIRAARPYNCGVGIIIL